MIGNIIDEEIKNIQNRYINVKIDNYIIMPNHVHLIVALNKPWQEQSPCPTLFDVICTLKSITTKRVNQAECISKRKIWQARFNDHIIRNQYEYEMIWNYVEHNITKWNLDKYYVVLQDRNSALAVI